jgi:hypothetical protein
VSIVAGYLVDLKGTQFDDDQSRSVWVHAMPPQGDFLHPKYGKISFTPERIKNFAAGVMNRIRGIDPDIDYDHKEFGGDAAGWVRAAEARPDGLWLLVNWTQTAYQKLKEGAYRYFSPEFHDEWTDAQGQVHKDVLFGGAITNRPFLKDLVPINLTEFIQASGGSGVNPDEVLKEIAKLLGLPDGTDPAVILGHVQAKFPAQQQQQQPQHPGGAPGAPGAPAPGRPPGQPVGASETGTPNPTTVETKDGTIRLDEATVQKLLSEHPLFKSMSEMLASQGKQLDEASVDRSLVQLSETAKTKNKAIPPAITEELKKQLLSVPPQSRDGIIKLFESGIESGALGVELGETSGAGGGHGKNDDAVKLYQDAITKKMSDLKLPYADAAEQVVRERPQLYTDYRRTIAAVEN